MNIVVTGGTGFIGRALCRALLDNHHRVSVLSRHPDRAGRHLGPGVTVRGWDETADGPWTRDVTSADAIVNLAGEPIADARWTAARKRVIYESRIEITRRLADVIISSSQRPAVLISASGIGYYGASDERLFDEDAGPGQGFLADLCVAWEREAARVESLEVRVVRPRFGMVLEKDGGALAKMLFPFRSFLGGPLSPGTQWVSWIHRRDVIHMIEWFLVTPTISGPVNAVAPDSVSMTEFCRMLGTVLHRPSWIPVPAFVLKLALGELSTVLTTGQRVMPAAALSAGYRFQYPSLDSALRAIFTSRRPLDSPTQNT
jgi:uncharacterized protein (TIGR01777 family)